MQPVAPASNAPGPESRVGTEVVGKWRLDALIGVGGMAAVYAATHRNRRRAALKILHLELARDGHVRERFLREGYLGNKVEHPGRVETLDNDETEDGAPFLVMELLEGQNLAELWRRMGKKLPVTGALRLIEQLLDFLSACHAVDIVHRDLKPANVFVTNDQRVKVLDFGVAQLRDKPGKDLTRAGTALGTPAFMAPEQARGLGDKLDGRTDIFSVGAMLYALLSGTRLHQGRTSDEALVLAATQPAPSLARIEPDLPVEVIALVDKALAWDRRNRFQTAAEMRAEVLRILDRPSMRAPAPTEGHAEIEDVEEPAEIAEGHPHLERLRAVFKQIDRLLPAVRQYGFAHPETERRLRGSFEEIVAALSSVPNGVAWDVRPYSFEHRARTIWEPSAPFDSVPWALFDSGLRAVQLRPGFSQAELRSLVEVMLTDPATDLAPEDDLVTLLWDRALPNVAIESADGLAEGGAAARERFHAESSELEGLAGRAAQAEARAMNVSTVREAETRSDALSSVLSLDPVTRAALDAQLRLTPERFRERWYDVLIDALLDSIAKRDQALVLAPLAASSADLVAAGKPELALATLRSLTEVVHLRVRGDAERALLVGALSRAMLGGEIVPLMAGVIAGDHVTTWAAGLAHLGAQDLPQLFRALERANDARVREVLIGAMTALAPGHEAEIASALPQLQPAIAQAVVAMLGKVRTPGAQAVLRSIAGSGDAALRITALSGTDEATLRKELGQLIEHENLDVRLAALQAVAQHQVKDLGSALSRRVEELFHDLATEERAALLDALQRLNPARAEQLAIGILSQRSMLKREAREQSRVVCAEHLGAHARSRVALEAVSAATKGLLGASKALEAAASAAATAIAARNPS
ncbi:MAG: protein kinase domain-containing protein [Polyangiales bacterium]